MAFCGGDRQEVRILRQPTSISQLFLHFYDDSGVLGRVELKDLDYII